MITLKIWNATNELQFEASCSFGLKTKEEIINIVRECDIHHSFHNLDAGKDLLAYSSNGDKEVNFNIGMLIIELSLMIQTFHKLNFSISAIDLDTLNEIEFLRYKQLKHSYNDLIHKLKNEIKKLPLREYFSSKTKEKTMVTGVFACQVYQLSHPCVLEKEPGNRPFCIYVMQYGDKAREYCGNWKPAENVKESLTENKFTITQDKMDTIANNIAKVVHSQNKPITSTITIVDNTGTNATDFFTKMIQERDRQIEKHNEQIMKSPENTDIPKEKQNSSFIFNEVLDFITNKDKLLQSVLIAIEKHLDTPIKLENGKFWNYFSTAFKLGDLLGISYYPVSLEWDKLKKIKDWTHIHTEISSHEYSIFKIVFPDMTTFEIYIRITYKKEIYFIIRPDYNYTYIS